MTQLAQDRRVAELKTPLGKDVLVLTNFTGTEGLSQLFEYSVEALSERGDIDFDHVIGQSCTVKQETNDGKKRFYNGVLVLARSAGKSRELFHYHLVLRPWFWLLGRRADCRIFLDKTVTDILREVFKGAGFDDFKFVTTGDYQKIPYCVQYRETDLAFCSRLMEHHGIYYFFEHADGKHTLVMADSRASHVPVPDLPKVPFVPTLGGLRTNQHLYGWVSDRKLRTGKVHFNDYDYLQPRKDLKAPKEAGEKYAHSDLELYDYHHKYDERGKGEDHARFRLEAEQAMDYRRRVHGEAPSLCPGGLVTVEGHSASSENQEYLVVQAKHMFSSQSYRSSGGGGDDGYAGSYDLLPSTRPYRAVPATPKPRIYGIQTATVVTRKGEEGQEISTDEHGRIWVRFHWDREPQRSCPVRVAQAWAGKKWGAIFLPRVGMEVVVDFLEGDPDRPLVTGCVYNGDNQVPYDLPANKAMTGWKSDSSRHNGGYNEFVFEDKQGQETIRLHAERDHELTVKHAETRAIGEMFTPPKGSPSRSTTLKNGDDLLTIQAGDQTISIPAGSQTTTVGVAISTTADVSITLTVGPSTLTICPGAISLSSPVINLTAESAVNITGATVNAGALLQTPALNAGAATVSGIPV
jgi:type VI secretion system secreted protein VgrG